MRKEAVVSSKRFMPCAGLVLALLAFGGQVFGDEGHEEKRIVLAVAYVVISLVIFIMRNRIARWWRTSIILPCGCAGLLLFVSVNALARVEWSQAAQTYSGFTRSLAQPAQSASSVKNSI